MALLSDDAEFYLQVGALWVLSATVAITILRGWIRGHGFHPNTSHLFVLGHSLVLAQDALRLLLVHGNIPKPYRCRRCPGDASVPAVWDCILLATVYSRDLASPCCWSWVCRSWGMFGGKGCHHVRVFLKGGVSVKLEPSLSRF
ncbi:uncharacterized protein LOC120712354 [Panicum virgatum]|uniref:uncharacterized protein LOC120712354 n=1 Tax=Panicum virgatum TaxID=38727 RepID=UPI0019D5CCBF|nr:uncharacterized protein LOC120712354 [Panicum virgatum]XP_039854050.1 uncharacterized protein LOC120712354 [Panicum virgatum]